MKSTNRYHGPFIFLGCVIVLLTLIASIPIDTKSPILRDIAANITAASVQQDEEQQAAEKLAKRRKKLEKLKPLFDTHSIPFSPEELALPNWRARLARTFESMPEFKQTRTVGKYLAGLYIADTLILPEKVVTMGDTFILVRHLVFEGPNPQITAEREGSFYAYPIESDNVRRVKIDPNSSFPEELAGVKKYLEGILRRDGSTTIQIELPLAIKLPENAKNIQVIGSYVYFQSGSDKTN